MTNLPITSREYKLMLNADRFRDRRPATESFLGLILAILGDEAQVKRLEKEKTRLTSYRDTTELALRRRGFSLRLREEGS